MGAAARSIPSRAREPDGPTSGAAGPAWARGALVVLLVVIATVSLAPFELELPGPVENRASRLADGTLRFSWESRAGTAGAPEWLPTVIERSAFDLHLRARSTEIEQHGPARVVAIAADRERADLMIGQEGSDLFVRLRRPGSDAGGEPPLVVDDLFADLAWHDIDLSVGDGHVRLAVDGWQVVDTPVPLDALESWSASHRLTLGNEVTGDRAWSGDVAELRIGPPGAVSDVLADPALEVPRTWWRYRLPSLAPSFGVSGVVDSTAHLALFAALGFVLAAALPDRPRQGLRAGLLVCVAVEAAQVLVAGRHSSVTDLVLDAASTAMGLALGRKLLWRRAEGRS